jgi:hypothetical protein
LFELLCLHNNESRNARSKTKIRGYPIYINIGRYNQRGKFFASFLLAQERWSLKPLGLAKIKKNIEFKNMVLFMIITPFVIASDQRERGNPWEFK